MVKFSSEELDATFSALSDPTRRAILTRLQQGEATVTELAEPFNMSLPAISKHLRVLEKAGLITRHVEGRTHKLILTAQPLRHATEWLAVYRAFWESSLDTLAELVEDDDDVANS
jgi:DNA-binding transcriptional ArsR family regulator